MQYCGNASEAAFRSYMNSGRLVQATAIESFCASALNHEPATSAITWERTSRRGKADRAIEVTLSAPLIHIYIRDIIDLSDVYQSLRLSFVLF